MNDPVPPSSERRDVAPPPDCTPSSRTRPRRSRRPPAAGIIDGPLRPAILRLALPAVGTTLFQVLFNITDTFWVGRTLGPDALAAVSLASYTVWVIVSIGELVGVGLTAVAARRHGEGDPASAARAAGTALVMALVLGVVVAVGGRAEPAGRCSGSWTPEGVVAVLAREFLVVQLLGAFLIYGYFVVTAAFRSAGDTRTPFLLLGASVLLNLVLDPLLILGWGPLPALGVYGAALATVLTRGLGFLVGIVLLCRRGGIRLGFEPAGGAHDRPDRAPDDADRRAVQRDLHAAGAGGRPVRHAGHRGAGRGAQDRRHQLHDLHRLRAGGRDARRPEPRRRAAAARAAGWLAHGAHRRGAGLRAGACVFLLVPAALVGVFTDDPAVIRDASLYLRAAGVAQLAMAFENVLEGALTGAGYTLYTMIAVVAISALRIPLAEARGRSRSGSPGSGGCWRSPPWRGRRR